ncbi:hypothetical protein HID58_048246 [Brassica napus]|uniref:G protein-coupled receptor n=1 Tax=Brassica napus TaxID=3708 RepID=A0ABQ8B1W3_BRANA|nr:hypothetical protein HID58_048246 [Brassica napus]
MTIPFNIALFFNVFNGFAFLSSLLIIPICDYCLYLRLYITIFLDPGGRISGIVFGYVLAFPLTIETMLLATFMAFTVDKHRRHLVDFPASCFCSYDATHLHFFLLFISLLFIIGVFNFVHHSFIRRREGLLSQINTHDHNSHSAGQMTIPFNIALFFNVFNGFAFLSSLLIITICDYCLYLRLYITIFLDPGGRISGIVFGYVLAFPLTIETMLLATFMAFTVDKHRRHLVDFPASCFCSYDATHLHFFLLFISLLFIIGVFNFVHEEGGTVVSEPPTIRFTMAIISVSYGYEP